MSRNEYIEFDGGKQNHNSRTEFSITKSRSKFEYLVPKSYHKRIKVEVA